MWWVPGRVAVPSIGIIAPGGFEPPFCGPKPHVLPLDEGASAVFAGPLKITDRALRGQLDPRSACESLARWLAARHAAPGQGAAAGGRRAPKRAPSGSRA